MSKRLLLPHFSRCKISSFYAFLEYPFLVKSTQRDSLFLGIFSLRIFRKPPFAHPLTLFEDLKDAPERGEGKDAQQGGKNHAINEQGAYCGYQANQQEQPPTAYTEVVFCLYDYGMKKTDNQERDRTDDETREIES